MKKIIIFLLLSYLSTGASYAQFVTQSADGKGTVILPLNGLSAGFDIGKTEISVGVNNYSKALKANNSKAFRNWFVGANLAAKNSSGIGNFFENGDVVPEANLLGFLGFNINNNESIITEWRKSSANTILAIEQKKRKHLVDSYKNDIIIYIKAASEQIDDHDLREKTKTELVEKIEKSADGFALSRSITSIMENEEEKLKNFVYIFKTLVEPRQKAYFESLSKTDQTKAIDSAFNDFVGTHSVKRFTPFIFGGVEARNFSLYTGLNTSSLPKSFIDTLHKGKQFGIGINAQIGSFWLGITYAFIDGDNFSDLSGKEYTLRTADTVGNQVLSSEKKITGYAGKYARVKSNQLNIDLLREFKLGDTSRLITNLYYRASLASKNTDYLKNISNVGLGIYFLGKKSKFIGGLYLELPDIDNNIEKGKPKAEQDIKPPLKKLTFGVVTKFTLSSVFGFNDRP